MFLKKVNIVVNKAIADTFEYMCEGEWVDNDDYDFIPGEVLWSDRVPLTNSMWAEVTVEICKTSSEGCQTICYLIDRQETIQRVICLDAFLAGFHLNDGSNHFKVEIHKNPYVL